MRQPTRILPENRVITECIIDCVFVCSPLIRLTIRGMGSAAEMCLLVRCKKQNCHAEFIAPLKTIVEGVILQCPHCHELRRYHATEFFAKRIRHKTLTALVHPPATLVANADCILADFLPIAERLFEL
jgi:hypothetical protein